MIKNKNLFKNIGIATFSQIISIIYSIFIKKLCLLYFPIELVGINTLFDSFFRGLSFFDIGFSVLLGVALYKTLNKNQVNESIIELRFFKTIYYRLALFLLILGALSSFLVIEFVDISGEYIGAVYIVYFVQLLELVLRFILMYKINILMFVQRSYIVSYLTILVNFIAFIIKGVAIYKYNNFIVFYCSSIFSIILINIFTVVFVNRYFPRFKNIKCLNFIEFKSQFKFVNFSKFIPKAIYNVVYTLMDNLIISFMFSLSSLAYISNYKMLFGSISLFINNVRPNTESFIANKLYTTNDSGFILFQKLTRYTISLTILVFTGFFLLADPFIELLFGKEYILNNNILFYMSATISITTFLIIYECFINIKGLAIYESNYLLIASVLNAISTIFLAKYSGIEGVYLATFITSLYILHTKISIICHNLFKIEKAQIYRMLIGDILVVIFFSASIILIINSLTYSNSLIINFIIKSVFIMLLNCICLVLNLKLRKTI